MCRPVIVEYTLCGHRQQKPIFCAEVINKGGETHLDDNLACDGWLYTMRAVEYVENFTRFCSSCGKMLLDKLHIISWEQHQQKHVL